MAFIQAGFFSPVIRKQVALYALVPEGRRGPFPVLYLLHGRSDDHSNWLRHTRIEYYARNLPLIVVMPDGFRGFYTDNHAGPAYGRYLIKDVLGFVERTFPALKKRSGRCIGGLSMGGYGSLRLAFSHPELFVSAHSHSGAVQPWALPSDDEWGAERRRIFGPHPTGGAHDILALAARLKRSGQLLPKLRLDCGEKDFLLAQNRRLHAHLETLKIPHEYAEFPGEHNWDYWDTHIQAALAFHCRALKISA
jgi:putative tributyrin esterase